jgi:hypothetical protein
MRRPILTRLDALARNLPRSALTVGGVDGDLAFRRLCVALTDMLAKFAGRPVFGLGAVEYFLGVVGSERGHFAVMCEGKNFAAPRSIKLPRDACGISQCLKTAPEQSLRPSMTEARNPGAAQ